MRPIIFLVAALSVVEGRGKVAGVKKRKLATSKRGGARIIPFRKSSPPPVEAPPPPPVVQKSSFGWAVLHNWLYFLSLGLCLPVLPRVIATLVNPDGSSVVSPRSSAVGGDVEGLDKLLTFLTVGFLGALSDRVGRKPLIAWSAFGYAFTAAIQASASKGIWKLYAADAIDGLTSCMNAVCSAYVVDSTESAGDRAVAVGIFQGISVAGAFVLGFPLSGILGKKDPRKPMWLAVAVSLLNGLIAVFVTPESLEAKKKTFDLRGANPVAVTNKLFASSGVVALAYALAWTANMALNTTFVNFVNKAFGWGPQQAGPLLIAVGLILAICPKLIVPRLGLVNSVKAGTLIYALAFASIGLATTPNLFFLSVLACGVGSTAVPALVACLASNAKDNERGATLGALQTLQELCAAFAYPLYGRVFAYSIGKADALLQRPGGAGEVLTKGALHHAVLAGPFYLAATLCIGAFVVFALSS